MACEFTVYLPPQLRNPIETADCALAEIEEMESLLTIYRDSSLMSYVNQHAFTAPVRCDARLYELLKRARELTTATDGAFDCSAGALVKAWGFYRGPRRVPTEDERRDALARTGMQHVLLDDEELSVRYAVDGLEINLGSIGKGYAIDRAIRRMQRDYGIERALVQGGQSSMYGLGSQHGDGLGWLVGVENPFNPSESVATVRLLNKAMGTSGTSNQYFESDGRVYGHVMDPRKGEPADELGSVSVIADDAATADALSTGLFVLGLDRAIDFCENHPDIAALIVLKPDAESAQGGRPRVMALNLSPQDFTVLPGFELPAIRKTSAAVVQRA